MIPRPSGRSVATAPGAGSSAQKLGSGGRVLVGGDLLAGDRLEGGDDGGLVGEHAGSRLRRGHENDAALVGDPAGRDGVHLLEGDLRDEPLVELVLVLDPRDRLPVEEGADVLRGERGGAPVRPRVVGLLDPPELLGLLALELGGGEPVARDPFGLPEERGDPSSTPSSRTEVRSE